MPELPEVETTRRGIAPYLIGHRIQNVVVRNRALRWPIPTNLKRRLLLQTVNDVRRRAKYLLIDVADGTLIMHLGMSGSLRIVNSAEPPSKHDHIDVVFEHGLALRLHDPRRFGAVLWTEQANVHPLIKDLGPEPWDATVTYLYTRARGRKQSIKSYIMDSHTIVGVGNIYASEALFEARIRPRRAAGRVSRQEYAQLRNAMLNVIDQAIGLGGTTLRDFVSATGEAGSFRQALKVYARGGQPCRRCHTEIKRIVTSGRAAYYCPNCQH